CSARPPRVWCCSRESWASLRHVTNRSRGPARGVPHVRLGTLAGRPGSTRRDLLEPVLHRRLRAPMAHPKLSEVRVYRTGAPTPLKVWMGPDTQSDGRGSGMSAVITGRYISCPSGEVRDGEKKGPGRRVCRSGLASAESGMQFLRSGAPAHNA